MRRRTQLAVGSAISVVLGMLIVGCSEESPVEPEKQQPVAVAQARPNVGYIGTPFTLDGAASSNTGGDTLTYAWTQITGPQATLSGADSARAHFTAAEEGTYVFSLVVSDGSLASEPNEVTITVTRGDRAITLAYALEAAVRRAIGKPDGDILQSDIAGLTSLNASGTWKSPHHMPRPDGVEHLTALRHLELDYVQMSDISPLSALTALEGLSVEYNGVADLSPLSGMTALSYLDLWQNQISDVGPLSGLTALTKLYLRRNQISDVSPLLGLSELTSLDLRQNQTTDLGALVENAGLGAGDTVWLSDNPLSEEALSVQIPALKARAVTVSY